MSRSITAFALLTVLGFGLAGCSELQARRHARTGNALYREGDYAGAVREYDQSEAYFDELQVVALNKGLSCRQLMVPGGKSADQDKAVDCALQSFSRAKQLNPEDPRGDALYVQTLFDADRYDALVHMYQEQLKGNPANLAAINGLITVYARSNDWRQALHWTTRRADLEPHDAEAQYGVGVMIHNQLYQKGGADKSGYNPWPDPNADFKKHPELIKIPPPFGSEDLVGEERIKLADQALTYLDKALAVRPTYREATIYVNLVYRQKALAYLEQPEQWQANIDLAEQWHKKAMEQAPQAPAP